MEVNCNEVVVGHEIEMMMTQGLYNAILTGVTRCRDVTCDGRKLLKCQVLQ